MVTSSLIRQKGKSQNGCYKKTKHAKFFEKKKQKKKQFLNADTYM